MSFVESGRKKQEYNQNYESGKKLAIFYDNRLKSLDNKVAIFRLISTIAFLAIIVGIFDKDKVVFNIFLILSFLIFCIVTSWIHKKIQSNQKKWNAIQISYLLSQARKERNFKVIDNYVSPWHKEVIKVPNGHIYAHDLDIHTQLFKLLDTCTTKEGSTNLFNLLMLAGIAPEAIEKINERTIKATALVNDPTLIRRLEVIKLSISSIPKSEDLDNKKIPEISKNKSLFYSIFTIISILMWAAILIPSLMKYLNSGNSDPLIQGLLTYGLFLGISIYLFQPVTEIANKILISSKKIEVITENLKNKNQLFKTLEFSFLSTISLKKIKHLNFLLSLLDLRGNVIFWITIHLLLPFDALLCFFLEKRIRNMQAEIEKWEKELHLFDLLCAFARFKIENSESKFITLAERLSIEKNSVIIEDIGHPFIPEINRITNTITISEQSPLILLTGSNMAGKSTFLRTLGVNILLSNMGAPVFAKKLGIKPSRILCAIRIDDSLIEGTSYFYAEVKRLKFILDSLAENNAVPGFFLIDEIFRGTNNKERYIGSLNIILNLFNKQSFGLISTHDLALAEIQKTDQRLVNMHFKEHIENNKLAFDYKLKQGPCPTTNALFIMQQEGLPIDLNN
ncbi:hypothetical protein QEJ31_14105 [Pigmentibacter sp. JX0631]|uniref:MutS-related protein n=1 Tax=Pigmentibacter sp. JX0631 TaxID=2976982 RepID=UPI002468E2F9|nr:hypothetical protein [Pigmentibacter sp. JX0631]WGL59661.1 hypothetical protein QEJ31_14105 [Pigmentibacter sp. JX0631]